MASRKVHIVGASILWLIMFIIYYFTVEQLSLQNNAMWIMMTFLLVQLGAQVPDYDIIWNKVLPHRNILTHSIFLPSLVCIPIAFITTETMAYLPLYGFFIIGYASHLLLDLRPKKWHGTSCIRFYWLKGERHRTMGKYQSMFWILINGTILMTFGILLMFLFYKWI